jgi:hypothetical protein
MKKPNMNMTVAIFVFFIVNRFPIREWSFATTFQSVINKQSGETDTASDRDPCDRFRTQLDTVKAVWEPK